MNARFAAAALVLFALGCNDATPEPALDARPFDAFPQTTLLCFDLRADRGLTNAGLRLRIRPEVAPGRRDVVLPFATKGVASNQDVLLASGTYGRFTILSMSVGAPSLGNSTIPFLPIARGFERPAIDGLEPGLYFQENGLERWLVFVDDTPALTARLQEEFPATKFSTYDAVAVAIPERAEGREVKDGRTVDPLPAVRADHVMLFTQRSIMDARRLAIRYKVPPSPRLAATSANLSKLVLVLLLPLFTLVLLDPNEIERPRLRLAVIWGGIALQVLFVCGVVWAARLLEPSPDTWLDVGVSTLGIAAEVAIMLVKSKRGRTKKAKARRP